MSTFLANLPIAIFGVVSCAILGYVVLKNLIIEPQLQVEHRFVEFLRDQKKADIERELIGFVENDDVIDAREWGILSTHLLGYSQQWSKRESDRKGPAHEVMRRLADDAVSDTHYFSKKIIEQVVK